MMQIPEILNYLGTGVKNQGPLFPLYDSTYINSSTPLAEVGTIWWTKGAPGDAGGNAFQYVKATAALARGQVTALAAATTGTVTSAGSTTSVINTNVTTTAVNSEVGNFIYFADIAATRLIRANTSGANASFTVETADPNLATGAAGPNVLASVPGNGSALTISRPYSRLVCTATLQPNGVALGTVTSGNYTIVQIAGIAECLAVGSVTATVFGVPAVTGAGGTVVGSAAAAANLYQNGGAIIPLHAWAGASQLVPCLVNFIGA